MRVMADGTLRSNCRWCNRAIHTHRDALRVAWVRNHMAQSKDWKVVIRDGHFAVVRTQA